MVAFICWYHLALDPQGNTRLRDNVITFYNPCLEDEIKEIISEYDTCQKQKQILRGNGHTAP